MDDTPCEHQDADPRHLDIVVDADEPSNPARRWLGIQFECCGAYARIYKNKAGTAYVGWCPQCARRVRIPIGSHGTDTRFFKAY